MNTGCHIRTSTNLDIDRLILCYAHVSLPAASVITNIGRKARSPVTRQGMFCFVFFFGLRNKLQPSPLQLIHRSFKKKNAHTWQRPLSQCWWDRSAFPVGRPPLGYASVFLWKLETSVRRRTMKWGGRKLSTFKRFQTENTQNRAHWVQVCALPLSFSLSPSLSFSLSLSLSLSHSLSLSLSLSIEPARACSLACIAV